MAGAHLVSQAAREGCLRYLATLHIFTPEQLRSLGQMLLFASARAVADKFWTIYHAAQQSPDPDDVWQLYVFGEQLEEVAWTLERLAVEPAHFRQFFHPIPQAA